MSRRLLTEIDKIMKEARATMEQYDERWTQLRGFNRQQIGVKEKMWEESRREQMRGKKHAVRTATLELLDFKHVCDSKSKMESDMESLLRRLHRHRQQLTEWLGSGELRVQMDDLRDLRKQIELRYKRGRVFYCMGRSSEDIDETDAGSSVAWISDFIEKLKQQAEMWEADIENVIRQISDKKEDKMVLGDRKAQLEAFVELHKMHIRRLEGILRALRSHAISITDAQAEEIRETLREYIDDNEDLTIVVAEEVYHDVQVPVYDSDAEPAGASPAASSDGTPEAWSPAVSKEADPPPKATFKSPPQPKAKPKSPPVVRQSAWQRKPAVLTAPAQPFVRSVSVKRTPSPAVGNYPQQSEPSPKKNLEASPTAKHTVLAEDVAACDWSYEGRGAETDAATANKTLSVKANSKLYIVKLDQSGWTFAFVDNPELVANPVVVSNDGVKQLTSEAMRTLSSGWFPDTIRLSVKASRRQRRAAKTKPALEGPLFDPSLWDNTGDDRTLLQRLQIGDDANGAMDFWCLTLAESACAKCSIQVVRWSWTGELMQECECDHRLLFVSSGDRVFVEQCDDQWVYGRKVDQQHKFSGTGGWFPSYLLLDPRDLLVRFARQLAAFAADEPFHKEPAPCLTMVLDTA